ncbi:MAG: EamA family transporter, partial [Pseudoxanthomonas sp.]
MDKLPTPVRAALLMLGSTMFFGLMVVAIRLASANLHTFEIAFFRNFFGLIATLPLFIKHGPGILRTQYFPRYLFRCLIGIVSMLCGFWAIGHLPLAQAVSLSYST